MSNKYNIFNNADMKRFTRDIEKAALSEAEKAIYSRTYDVACPHCSASVSIPAGKSVCPVCRKDINLDLSIRFE